VLLRSLFEPTCSLRPETSNRSGFWPAHIFYPNLCFLCCLLFKFSLLSFVPLDLAEAFMQHIRCFIDVGWRMH
jgi:hypothetical protein